MCGIAGCLTRMGEVPKERFEAMVDIVAHRGPDDRGCYYEERLALGHRRLSVIDLSREGRQPFVYQDRYVLVYNGEIYNYRDLREELCAGGYVFGTGTDTEVLAALYDRDGSSCVGKLNGMWAFSVWDKEKKTLFCSRDRFGVKPFYYWLDEEKFLFASEIKQLFKILEDRPRANRQRLLEFLVAGDMDFTEETMFAGVKQLPPGHNLFYEAGNHRGRLERYYDLSKTSGGYMSYEEACSLFAEVFQSAVEARHVSDVPVGYCLSGGVDSSAIVCMADRIRKREGTDSVAAAVSSCFEDKCYDEREYIHEVIKKTGIKSFQVFPKGEELFEKADELIWHMDEPFGSTSVFAQWEVFRCAKEHGLTVMLDGQGADEQLAGYSGFYSVIFANCLKKFQFGRLRREVGLYLCLRAGSEKQVSSAEVIASAILSLLLPGRAKNRVKRWSGYYKRIGVPFPEQVLKQVWDNRKVYPVGNDRAYILDSMRCGMASLLHFEDRNSMAHSVESRVPFLDYRLAEFLYTLPLNYKLRDGRTKAVMRDGLQGILPEKIRNRYSKMGFVTPEDQWINEHYSQYREELRSACERLSPLVETDRVMKWFDDRKGNMPQGEFLAWRIICAGRWMKVFNVAL